MPLWRRQSAPAPEPEPTAAELLLRAAVDRNAAARFVRTDRVDTEPLAASRLLTWTGDEMIVEPLSVDGDRMRLNAGHRLEGYVALDQRVVGFQTAVVGLAEPFQLNERTVLDAIRLTPPREIAFSDRRLTYRVKLASLEQEVPISLWFLDRYGEADDDEGLLARAMMETVEIGGGEGVFTSLEAARLTPPPPELEEDGRAEGDVPWERVTARFRNVAPHARAIVVDLTAASLGVTLFGIEASFLRLGERVVARIDLPEDTVEGVGVIRRTAELSRSRARIGIQLIHPDPSHVHHPTRRTLEQLSLRIQRAELRRRASRLPEAG